MLFRDYKKQKGWYTNLIQNAPIPVTLYFTLPISQAWWADAAVAHIIYNRNCWYSFKCDLWSDKLLWKSRVVINLILIIDVSCQEKTHYACCICDCKYRKELPLAQVKDKTSIKSFVDNLLRFSSHTPAYASILWNKVKKQTTSANQMLEQCKSAHPTTIK